MGVAVLPADGSLDVELDAALGRGWRLGAEIEIDVRRLGARQRVLVVVGVRVGAGTGGLAAFAAAGWAALAAHHVHAVGLEGAAGGGAVDVGDVIPDGAAGERVLELRDGGWVAAGLRLGELQ